MQINIPENVKDAAKIVFDWLGSEDFSYHIISVEEIFYDELKASEKRTQDFLSIQEGIPAFVTIHGTDATKAVLSYIVEQ